MLHQEKINASVQRVVNMYFERFPLVPHYGIHLTSIEDDSEATYYYQMTDEEMAVLHAWKDNDVEMTLHEYLEECAKADDSGKYQDMLDCWSDHPSALPLDIVDSCDLEHPLFFTHVGVRQLDDKNELRPQRTYGMSVSEEEMKQLLRIYIMGSNRISFNQLMYIFPDFSSKLNQHIAWTLYDGICESHNPFIIDMLEVKEMVQNICSPEIDVLNLCAMEDDEEIQLFLNKYEIVPECNILFEENNDQHAFHVESYFYGHKFCLFWEEIPENTFANWPSEKQYYDADLLCKALHLDGYKALQDYVKERYSTKTAFADFKAWAEQNCPGSIK